MIGVVADDITGAHDIGSMFAKSGALVHVFSYEEELSAEDIRRWGLPDVIVIDTDSRFDSPNAAYEKVFRAVRLLRVLGCRQFYKKTCSVFRGNIGPELDAVLDALGEDFAGIVVGFPKNGRQTIDGIHYVHGIKLEESEFRNDPVHPMHCSSLVELLASQTRRSVGLIRHTVVNQGVEAVRREVGRLRESHQYVIFDVVDQTSLKTIAGAIYHLPVLGGSSALAEELPVKIMDRDSQTAISPPPTNGMGILCAAGSLMPQTKAQVEYMRQQGIPVFELDTLQVLDDNRRHTLVQGLCRKVGGALQEGSDVVVHTSNDPGIVAETKRRGQVAGQSAAEVSRLVSEALAEVVANCVEELGLNRLLIAGGDTSASVCSQLGIKGMRVWREIEPGIPSCISLGGRPLFLVLKSGSFGSPDFFAKAAVHLRSGG
ncbi:MAG TPA: four-carbon acid sugar kinase family protein [Firmicutes bacterium]|nr:four-carbon acid sugar kinase family protein [Bacillota bacterium]